MAMSEFAWLVGFLLGTLGFVMFLVVDICKAIKTGAHYVPGYFLVLSAFTIQIMKFVEYESNQAFLGQNLGSSKVWEDEEGKRNFIMIHSSRIMLCVLVAIFLPGVARPRSEEKWTKIFALGLSVILDLSSEILTLSRLFLGYSFFPSNGYSWDVFVVSDVLIITSLIWLSFLLVCVTGASKSIRDITAQRIPFILAKPDLAEKLYWKRIEDQVLKSWIVARVCSPESIIAKSMVVSSAALVVTVCIISSGVGWILHGPIITIPRGVESWLRFMITILEVVFIVVGWFVIVWRSLTSIRFYRRDENECWFKRFWEEDFWTKHIGEKLREEAQKHHFPIEDFWTKQMGIKYHWTRQMDMKESKKQGSEDMIKKITEAKWSKSLLLKGLFLLLIIVVFFSKVSRFLIEVTLYNGIIRKIVSLVSTEHNEENQYKTIFENMAVVGETPSSVFATNRKAIKQAKRLSKEGQDYAKRLSKEGQDCAEYSISLISFLKEWSSSTQKLPPLRVGVRRVVPEDENGLKFLCKVSVDQDTIYFEYMSERSWSWKLTAVSLINIIVCLSPPWGKDCVEAYIEAWQLMDLVDEWDPETDSLLSEAADREFNTLMDKFKQSDFDGTPTTMTMDLVEKELGGINQTELAAEGKKKDWEKLAGAIALHKLCKGIDCREGDFTELMEELKRSLAGIIAACIDKVGTALVENCRKWAQDLEEKKLSEAIYIAGKSRGLMEALKWEQESSMV